MKCPTCKKEVEIKDNYQHSLNHNNDGYIEPCDTCANNRSDTDEIPCIFCKHNPDTCWSK